MITVVSGLPRSGTSLMMQMLQAGGHPILSDHLRPADANNPREYLEFDKVRQMERDISWVAQAEGRAVKVVSLLLARLPSAFNYRVIFMRRELDEVLQSQEAMLARLGRAVGPDRGAMRKHFERHLEVVTEWISRQPHIQSLDCEYAHVVRTPEATARTVAAFLQQPLNIEAMTSVVDPALYRQRR